MRANHESARFPFGGHDIELGPGQFISSHDSAIKELTGGFTVQKLRTVFEYLKSTDRITIKSTNKFSIITVTNWSQYQSDNRQNNKQITNEQQTDNKQITTNKNDKELKNEKNIRTEVIFPDGLNTEECRAAWERWLEYKRVAKKGAYKSIDSQQSMLKQLANEFKTAKRFVEAIDFSIGKDYAGVFERPPTEQRAAAPKPDPHHNRPSPKLFTPPQSVKDQRTPEELARIKDLVNSTFPKPARTNDQI